MQLTIHPNLSLLLHGPNSTINVNIVSTCAVQLIHLDYERITHLTLTISLLFSVWKSDQPMGMNGHPAAPTEVARTEAPMPQFVPPQRLGKKFCCSTCRSSFSYKRSLMYHQRYECGKAPRYKCPYCDYDCRRKSNVHRHIRLRHNGQQVCSVDIYSTNYAHKTPNKFT